MSPEEAKQVLDKIVATVFGYENPLSLDDAMRKFAFDLRLPQQVYDYTTAVSYTHLTLPTILRV